MCLWMATGASVADWRRAAAGRAGPVVVRGASADTVVAEAVVARGLGSASADADFDVAGPGAWLAAAAAAVVVVAGTMMAGGERQTDSRWETRWTKSSACASGRRNWRTGPLALPLAATPSCWARQVVEATNPKAGQMSQSRCQRLS